MIVNVPLLKELFRGFTVQRWNDKIRPVELIEMDKHAHKMFIAYCIGKMEEQVGNSVNWDNIIKGGIYELFRRIVISDIKSPIYYKIQQDYKSTFDKLNKWVFEQLKDKISNAEIANEFEEYLFTGNPIDDFSSQILAAAHKYSSYWEFLIIKNANPDGYKINEIERLLLIDIDSFLNFIAVRKMITKQSLSDLVDIFGQLRFQTRWSQIPRVPKTSVLGHSMLVAVISYFFARENNACSKRLYNDFFGGLVHDLPEAVTRDIISPVKRSSDEFEQLIKSIESDLAEKEIFSLVDSNWQEEFRYFTIDEFKNKIVQNKSIKYDIAIDEINKLYNHNNFNPIDGEFIRAADQIAAYLEAWNSTKFGIKSSEFFDAQTQIKENYSGVRLGISDIEVIFKDLDN